MYCTSCYQFMSDKTIDLTAVHLCNECKEDLKKKKEPVNAITLQKTLDAFKAWIAKELKEVREAIQEVQAELQEDETDEEDEDLPEESQGRRP